MSRENKSKSEYSRIHGGIDVGVHLLHEMLRLFEERNISAGRIHLLASNKGAALRHFLADRVAAALEGALDTSRRFPVWQTCSIGSSTATASIYCDALSKSNLKPSDSVLGMLASMPIVSHDAKRQDFELVKIPAGCLGFQGDPTIFELLVRLDEYWLMPMPAQVAVVGALSSYDLSANEPISFVFGEYHSPHPQMLVLRCLDLHESIEGIREVNSIRYLARATIPRNKHLVVVRHPIVTVIETVIRELR